VQTLIAAKLEEAAGVAFAEAMGALSVASDEFKTLTMAEAEAQATDVYQSIIHIITPDMSAALEARDARIRREGMEQAARVVSAYRIEAMRRPEYTHEAFDAHIAAIRADGGK
jgi:hypothetical protein